MISKDEMQQLWEEVKENNRKWRRCPKHFFPHKDGVYGLRAKATCANCGAWADLSAVMDYTRGYVAAGGDPNDVFPDFKN
jgi:hypothetical protein